MKEEQEKTFARLDESGNTERLTHAATTETVSDDWDAILAEAERYLGGEPLPGTTKPLYDALRKTVAYVKSVREAK